MTRTNYVKGEAEDQLDQQSEASKNRLEALRSEAMRHTARTYVRDAGIFKKLVCLYCIHQVHAGSWRVGYEKFSNRKWSAPAVIPVEDSRGKASRVPGEHDDLTVSFMSFFSMRD